jgi:hypothetical protein
MQNPSLALPGLNFMLFCENEYPAGSIAKLYGPASKLHGLEATRWTIRQHCDLFSAASQHLPQKLAETGIEALVIDTHTFLEVVPMSLGIPYAQVWNALHLDLSGATRPDVFSWPYETTPEALSKPVVTAPIVGATKPHHLEDAVAALSVRLTAEEITALEEPYRPHPVLGFS